MASPERIDSLGIIEPQSFSSSFSPEDQSLGAGITQLYEGRDNYLSPSERRSHVAEIRLNVLPSDMEHIYEWIKDPETRGHLDPPPRIGKPGDKEDEDAARDELWDYYQNKGNEPDAIPEPHKIQPLVAVNYYGEPTGVLTLRWKGDATAPRDKRIASIERFIVNPDYQGKVKNGQHSGPRIGTKLLQRALQYAFEEHSGYKDGQSAREVRAWVMTDREAGDYSRNFNLLLSAGFNFVQGPRVRWSDYQKLANIPENYRTDREAVWFKLPKENWLERQERHQPAE